MSGPTGFVLDADITSEPLPPEQKIFLDWQSDVPVDIQPKNLFGYEYFIIDDDATMTASAFGTDSTPEAEAFRNNVMLRVQQIFRQVGIDNISITDSPSDGATVIYFTDESRDNLSGIAYTGVDRFNRSLTGEAVVFTAGTLGDEEDIAETTAHEIGHLLGLRHVSPVGLVEIMKKGKHNSDDEMFNNLVSDIDEITSLLSHNPIYHLKRYVDGVPHNALVSQQIPIEPGSYDQSLIERILARFDFTDTDGVLYNLRVFTGFADAIGPLASFDEITLSELSQLEFAFDGGNGLQFVAASTLGGDLDIVLATGDPYQDENVVIHPVGGQLQAYLQMYSDSDSGYTTINEVTLTSVVVPEPSTFLLAVAGFLGFLILPVARFQMGQVNIELSPANSPT